MKLLFCLLLFIAQAGPAQPVWKTDFDEAKTEAAAGHKMILLSFSGSDWCIPCIRLHKEVFESSPFAAYAQEHLVLLNADFPRLKKNQLSAEQTKKNEMLADKYNPKGSFPLTVLLDANGTVVKEWDGFPKESVEQFITELKTGADR